MFVCLSVSSKFFFSVLSFENHRHVGIYKGASRQSLSITSVLHPLWRLGLPGGVLCSCATPSTGAHTDLQVLADSHPSPGKSMLLTWTVTVASAPGFLFCSRFTDPGHATDRPEATHPKMVKLLPHIHGDSSLLLNRLASCLRDPCVSVGPV